MKPLPEILTKALREAARKAFPDLENVDAVCVEVSRRPDLADYQCNAAMPLAKNLKRPPLEIAQAIVDRIEKTPEIGAIEAIKPGFINLKVSDERLSQLCGTLRADDRLGVESVEGIPVIVIDYGSPNVSKELHVGHIRSALIGNTFDRVYRFLGWKVIADNHLGDWGTQFGILIRAYKRYGDPAQLVKGGLAEIEALYRKGNAEAESDEQAREEARSELVKLHQGDTENLAIWKQIVDRSIESMNEVYERLGVRWDTVHGESAYHGMLAESVEILLEKGVARESQGAMVVFFEDDPSLKDNPFIVRKRDGGFNYASTDIATIRYRLEHYHPKRIVYVTDGRQQLHFRQLFATAAGMGWDKETELVHIWFGTIKGEDGKPLKTRAGETPKLMPLLDEAEQRALTTVNELSPDLPEEEKSEIARAVGIGALKYMDLSQNRQSDYVFSYDRMLALDGNTAPYLQYTYARTRSILRKYEEQVGPIPEDAKIAVCEPAERALALIVARFPEAVSEAAESYRPNALTDYLYLLATTLNKQFYHDLPVLKSESPTRESRLLLCDLVSKVLKKGLDLLGIEVVERM